MKYYFSGSEIQSWREILTEQNVPTVSLSYMGLKRRFKKTADNWKISSNYANNQQVFLDSGAYTLNRPDSEYTYDQAYELLGSYLEFVLANHKDIALVSEFDAKILGKDQIYAQRSNFENMVPPEKFMPIWHVEDGQEELDKLCSEYEVVGVTSFDLHDTSLISAFNTMVNRYGVRLHGVAITSKEMMQKVAWDSVSSTSWLSPSIYGDTIVWTGKELKRYPKAYKNQARKKHRTLFEENGFDYTKIEADDSKELLKLSVWSWQQFVNSIDKKVTTQQSAQNAKNKDMTYQTVDTQGTENRNEKLLPAITKKRETENLPIMGIIKKAENPEEEDSKEVPYVHIRSESMRVCNTCFLKKNCPRFEENANCAYNIPIEVKTKDQLKALQDALVEMQSQRVLFMRMAEDLEGGYADPNLSSEMDRLQRMIKAKEDSERDFFTMTQTATISSGKPGFLAQIIGEKAAGKLRELDAPVKADDLIKESDIYDAEIIDG